MGNVLDLKNLRQAADAPIVAAAVVESAEPEPEEAPEIPATVEDDPETGELAGDSGYIPESVSWEAHHPLTGEARRKHLYVSLGLVLFGVLMSVWQMNPSAFIVMLLGAAALELREHYKKPTAVTVDARGVEIDGRRIDHADFASFHIHRMPDDTLELSLRSDRKYLPHLRLPLGDQNPYELHAVLATYIPEGEHRIPLTEYFIRKPRG